MALTLHNFTSRLPASAQQRHREAIETAIAIANNFERKAAEIGGDGRYSDSGKAEAIKSHLEQGPMAHLNQIKATVDGELNAIRGERASYVPKNPDKNDLFGEMQRAEIRTWLRSLPESERMRVALTATDEAVRSAILYSPAALSGLSEEVKQTVVNSYLDATHGARLAELERAETAVLEVSAAVDVACAVMQRISDAVPK